MNKEGVRKLIGFFIFLILFISFLFLGNKIIENQKDITTGRFSEYSKVMMIRDLALTLSDESICTSIFKNKSATYESIKNLFDIKKINTNIDVNQLYEIEIYGQEGFFSQVNGYVELRFKIKSLGESFYFKIPLKIIKNENNKIISCKSISDITKYSKKNNENLFRKKKTEQQKYLLLNKDLVIGDIERKSNINSQFGFFFASVDSDQTCDASQLDVLVYDKKIRQFKLCSSKGEWDIIGPKNRIDNELKARFKKKYMIKSSNGSIKSVKTFEDYHICKIDSYQFDSGICRIKVESKLQDIGKWEIIAQHLMGKELMCEMTCYLF